MRPLLLIGTVLLLLGCAGERHPSLLPLPQKVEWLGGDVPSTVPVKEHLVDSLPGVRLNGQEAYTLCVGRDSIVLEAISAEGLRNARKTLSQLETGGRIPRCRISDWPAFRVRGWMLDVGRTFMSMEELYREVDILSRFKLNVLHLHLTENQAWRLESRRYPQLNAAGSMTRQPGLFYTQEQMRALDAYCRERGVMLVPELDMPGHSAAFERAMGFPMQSPRGKEVLKELLEEAMEVFSAPWVHIGTDEVRFTDPSFVPEMVEFIRSRGRKVVSWNPGWKYAPGEIDATQLWSYRGKAQAGIPAVDCRLHYINHYDLFGDIVALHTSRICGADEGSEDLAGSIIALWNDRHLPSDEAIVRENNLYASALSLADRAWRGGGYQYFDAFGAILPAEGPARADFEDFEARMLSFRESLLKDVPFPYVAQSGARWFLSEVYPNEGNLEAVFPPERGEAWTPERMVCGSGVYLRHVWGPGIVPGVYPAPEPNSTVYAAARIQSPSEQEVGLVFETQNHSRSEHDTPAPEGAWDHRHSRLWLNGEPVPAPAGTVRLKKGWNTVLVKLPVGAFSTPETRLVKWMFTCAFTTPNGRRAADLIYSDKL